MWTLFGDDTFLRSTWFLLAGTAGGGTDFVSLISETVSFADGVTTAKCTITITDDQRRELQEHFTVNLATVTKGNPLISAATVTINDNDNS